MSKRVLDLLVALPLLAVCSVPLLLIAAVVRGTSRGPALHWSQRVGRDNRLFWMPKFRTMRVGTPQLATHLLSDAARWLTPIGRWLRRTSLDELPQLWSVVTGHMTLVGPRPALFNQDDLIALRTARGIHRLVPGLTGWAQIHGRDELSIPAKVALDAYYLEHRSLGLDLRILFRTCVTVLRREGIRQADELPAALPTSPKPAEPPKERTAA